MLRYCQALTCAILASTAATQNALPPGNFADHEIRALTARNVTKMLQRDTNGDGIAELLASIPASSEVHSFDGRTGGRLVLRGTTGTGFGRLFTLADLDPATQTVSVVVSSNTGISIVPADTLFGGIFRPLPPEIGALRSLEVGNFDTDPDEEVALIGATGWVYYDGALDTMNIVEQAIGLSDIFGFAAHVRRNGTGPDHLLVSAAGATPPAIWEYDGVNPRTTFAQLPPTTPWVDALTEVQGEVVAALYNGGFAQPFDAVVRSVDAATQSFRPPVWTGAPSERVLTLTRADQLAEYFASVRSSVLSETILRGQGFNSPLVPAIQASPGVGLDVCRSGKLNMFVDNTPALVVRQSTAGPLSYYDPTGPVDLRVTGTYFRGGDPLTATARLDPSDAGLPIAPLISLQIPMRTFVPGVLDMSFTIDPLTSASSAFFTMPTTVDAAGLANISTTVPIVPGGGLDYRVSIGWITLRTNGQLVGNRTGSMVYFDL